MSTPTTDLDRLLENAGWVRALGVELVGVGEADDLAQDAWVIALERGATARNAAAWLSGVVRRLAGRRVRGEERRSRREHAAARPEAQPGPDELVGEAELSRELIRAVTELAEPYRSTVLLRFYRGWSGEEIAAHQGVPGATVRTRLARALAELRERLDREHGGRAAWAVVFAGPAGLAPAAAPAPAPWLASSKVLYSGVAALAAVAGIALWQSTKVQGGDSNRIEDVAAAADAVPSEPAGLVSEPASAAGAGAALLSQRTVAPAAPLVDEVLLYGSVVDREGQPVQLEILGLMDHFGTTRSADSPPTGVYSLAGLAPGRHTLSARARGFVSLHEEVEIAAGRPHQRRDLVFESALEIPVRLLDESGALLDLQNAAPGRSLDVAVTRDAPHDGLFGLAGNPSLRLGCGEFVAAGVDAGLEVPNGCSGLVRLRVSPPVHVSLVVRDAVLETRRIDGPVDVLEFTLDRAQVERRLGGVRARFVDALTGQPIRGGSARLDAPSSYSTGGEKLGDDAVAVLPGHAPGFYTLRFFHPEYEQLMRNVRVPAGNEADVGDVRVWPRATIRATVLGAEGEPLWATARWLPAELVRGPADIEWNHAWGTSGGRLVIEGVSRGLVRLFVSAKGHALYSRTVDASSGLVDGLVLQLEEGTSVLFRPGNALGRQLTLADASGTPLATWGLGDYTIATRLVPGRYQLWLGDAERVDSVEELIVGGEPLVKDIVVEANGRER